MYQATKIAAVLVLRERVKECREGRAGRLTVERKTMIKKNKRMLALILVLAMTAMLIAALPTVAGAATGMATIDLSTLGAMNADNSANVATESQWSYTSHNARLSLTTANGVYILTGTNNNIYVSVESGASNAHITLDGVSITRTDNSPFQIAHDCTITLVGTNTITTTSSHAALYITGVACVINGDGSLTLTAPGSAIFVDTSLGGTLSITESASVFAMGENAPIAMTNPTPNIRIGDNASFTMGNSESAGITALYYFTQADATTTHQWKLSGSAALYTGSSLTDATIRAYVPKGTPGTIAREPIPVAPIITSPNTLSVVAGTGGSLPLTATGTPAPTWSLTGAPAGVSITGSTLTVASTVPAGTYAFTITASNGVEPDATQSFTLTVTKAGGGNGGGDNGGGGKMPATGDALSLLAPLALLVGSAVCSYIAADRRKHH